MTSARCIVGSFWPRVHTRMDFAFSAHFLTFALTDEIGVEGGLIAQFYWDWLHIEVVAVPERWRGNGPRATARQPGGGGSDKGRLRRRLGRHLFLPGAGILYGDGLPALRPVAELSEGT